MATKRLMRTTLCDLLLLATFIIVSGVHGDCVPNHNTANDIHPVAADKWTWAVVASGLNRPRSIVFDSRGRLIVLEAGMGDITSIQLSKDAGACVKETSRRLLRRWGGLNHGLPFSKDGSTLYASTSEYAYSWGYDKAFQTLYQQKLLVSGMDNPDHTTRTLLKSTFDDNMLIVSRGSNGNIDPGAASVFSGRSQIKAFDLSQVPNGGYNFTTQGTRLGWGLRNSVGIAEHPITGGIYSVENSADNFIRDSKDVHESNPGEELNFHGTLLKNTYGGQGRSYGYPGCFAA